MKPVSMDVHIEYLLTYLQDEFRDIPDLRIHPVAPAGLQKSIDLPQDYDPNTHQVHLNRGVRIRIGSRDFFFPADWDQEKILAQCEEIRVHYSRQN